MRADTRASKLVWVGGWVGLRWTDGKMDEWMRIPSSFVDVGGSSSLSSLPAMFACLSSSVHLLLSCLARAASKRSLTDISLARKDHAEMGLGL